MRVQAWIVAIGLLSGMLGLASPALGSDEVDEEPFVLGGPHAALEWPPDPVTILDQERAVASTTCGVDSPIQPPLIPPPHPALTGEVGGGCFVVHDYPDDAVLSVSVQRAFVSVPENRIHFAAGYDGDDDNCIGCSPADTLWRGAGTIEVPMLEDENALVVFVYGASADEDPFGPSGPVQTALLGKITVQQTGTSSAACDEQPGTPEGRCGVSLDQPRPHVCVPACEPIIDYPT